MSNIEFNFHPYGDGESKIDAIRNGKPVGFIEYFPDDESGGYQIFNISSSDQRKGLGSTLIRKFVEKVGPGVNINALITHKKSRQQLDRLGYFKQAKNSGSISINDKEELEKLPIIRLAKRGGLKIAKIEINYGDDSYYDGYQVRMFGST